jgi:hypothetical protein
MSDDQTELELFLAFSSSITGYSPFRLRGTGQAEAYLHTVNSIVGDEVVSSLLKCYQQEIETAEDNNVRDSRLRMHIFGDGRFGPIARNMIKLWYVGVWYQLPAAWRDKYGANEGDITFVVSPSAYTEGLLWPTVGANPPGVKGPGYGTWAEPPRIPEI